MEFSSILVSAAVGLIFGFINGALVARFDIPLLHGNIGYFDYG